MARQNINKGTTANDGSGDTLRTAAGKINDNFVEIYTLLGGSGGQITEKVSLADAGVQYNGNTHNTTLGFTEGSAALTITLPASSGVVTLNDATQTLTNKTITSPVLTTPQINDTSADHQYIIAVSELAADRTITLPLLTGNDELVFKDHTQTLINKTLTTPVLANPSVTGSIKDVNNAHVVEIDPSASAVNYLKLSNAATGGIPQMASYSATDTDVGLGLSGQNDGLVHIQTGLRYRTDTISADAQAVPLNRPMTIFNAGGAISATLANGASPGHAIVLVNKGSAEVTVTPANFAPATSFTLRQEGITQVIWSGAEWHIMAAKLFSSSDADALVYVTT